MSGRQFQILSADGFSRVKPRGAAPRRDMELPRRLDSQRWRAPPAWPATCASTLTTLEVLDQLRRMRHACGPRQPGPATGGEPQAGGYPEHSARLEPAPWPSASHSLTGFLLLLLLRRHQGGPGRASRERVADAPVPSLMPFSSRGAGKKTRQTDIGVFLGCRYRIQDAMPCLPRMPAHRREQPPIHHLRRPQ